MEELDSSKTFEDEFNKEDDNFSDNSTDEEHNNDDNHSVCSEDSEGSQHSGGDLSEIETQKKLMKTYVNEFCKIDDELRQLKLAVKERTGKLKELKTLIGGFMSNNSVDFFNLQSGGSISLKQSMKFKSLNKDQTLELYTLFLGDKEKAIKLQEFLKTNREKVPNSNLVRKLN